MFDQPTLVSGLLAVGAALYLYRWLYPGQSQLSHIPTVGPSAPILSYWGALRYMTNGMAIVTHGYNKYKGGLYKVANFDRWVVVVSGPKLVDEFSRAVEDNMSFRRGLDAELPAISVALGAHLTHDDYFVRTIRTTLTNHLDTIFSDVRDEIDSACSTYMPVTDKWTTVPAFDTMVNIVARVSNRAFVGLPYCRDEEYIKVMTQLILDTVVAGHVMTPFPDFLKPTVTRYFTRLPRTIDKCIKFLKPEIEKRLRNVEEGGSDYMEKPFDFLSWLIDAARGEEKEVSPLMHRIMLANFASMHTVGIVGTFALFQVAANPQYAKILREEVQEVVGADGWSKGSIEAMPKLDSFLKEILRLNSIASINILRQAVRDYTFSDGTFIPKGTLLKAAVLPMQRDPEYYENPDLFLPWRFSDARNRDGDLPKHSSINIDIDYLTFGYGRHTCPGRWFAATELKLLLAHLVTTYDMKMQKDGVVPHPVGLSSSIVPDPRTRVLFRKRQV